MESQKQALFDKDKIDLQFKSDTIYLLQQIHESIALLSETLATQNELLDELFMALPQAKRFVLRK